MRVDFCFEFFEKKATFFKICQHTLREEHHPGHFLFGDEYKRLLCEVSAEYQATYAVHRKLALHRQVLSPDMFECKKQG